MILPKQTGNVLTITKGTSIATFSPTEKGKRARRKKGKEKYRKKGQKQKEIASTKQRKV